MKIKNVCLLNSRFGNKINLSNSLENGWSSNGGSAAVEIGNALLFQISARHGTTDVGTVITSALPEGYFAVIPNPVAGAIGGSVQLMTDGTLKIIQELPNGNVFINGVGIKS